MNGSDFLADSSFLPNRTPCVLPLEMLKENACERARKSSKFERRDGLLRRHLRRKSTFRIILPAAYTIDGCWSRYRPLNGGQVPLPRECAAKLRRLLELTPTGCAPVSPMVDSASTRMIKYVAATRSKQTSHRAARGKRVQSKTIISFTTVSVVADTNPVSLSPIMSKSLSDNKLTLAAVLAESSSMWS